MSSVGPVDVISVVIDVINVFKFLTFYILPRFLKKTLSKSKYEYAKIQRETVLQDASAIFIDFGLLRSSYCKMSYLLAEAR